jgi:ureidoacrylate peracid hydrolase
MSLALAPFEVIEERRTTPRWNNMLANTVEVANKGRAAGATVMHAPISFAEGYGELTTHPYGILKGVVDNKAFRRGSWGAAIVDALTPQPQDILIEGERGLDAVSSTNLDFILRSSHDEFLNLLAGRAR